MVNIYCNLLSYFNVDDNSPNKNIKQCFFCITQNRINNLIHVAPFTWFNINPKFPTSIINYIHYRVWDEITYPFLNFNGEV